MYRSPYRSTTGVSRRLDTPRKGTIRFYGQGGKPRELELHTELHQAYQAWLDDRTGWRDAATNPTAFLNHRSRRLSVRGASAVFTALTTTYSWACSNNSSKASRTNPGLPTATRQPATSPNGSTAESSRSATDPSRCDPTARPG